MDLSVLNNKQKEAVDHLKGPLLVVAGAGSGKTRVITYRIANLLEHGIKPYNILAITFTNKAANEMKERVENLLGIGARDCTISTFHSLCNRILHIDIERIGMGRNFNVIDTDDSKSIMRKIIKDLGYDTKKTKERPILSEISKAKNINVGPEEYAAKYTIDDFTKKVSECYIEYEKRKFISNVLDFDDLLVKTAQLFKENPDVLDKYQEKYKYILIDEYQDTNDIQFLIVSYLAGKYKNICVVGDEDQSIYSFRGANIRNILSFETDFENAKIIKLEQNYRSTQNILSVANRVISNNIGRKEKVLWTENPSGDPVIFEEYLGDKLEASEVIKRIKKNKNYSKTAILYRANSQSKSIEEACIYANIPYRLIGGVQFYKRKEVKDMIAYLRLCLNENDDISLIRIINTPARGIGESSIEKLRIAAANKNCSMFSLLKTASEVGVIKSTAKKMNDFYNMIIKAKTETDVKSMLMYFKTKIGYLEDVEASEGVDIKIERESNIDELINKAAEFVSNDTEDTMDSLNNFLNEVSLVADIDELDMIDEKLTLMTVHASKGLEFDSVYIIGFSENLFPSAMSLLDGDIGVEEERRLAYVAMTRARKNLYISSAVSKFFQGKSAMYMPSRFVDEAKGDGLECKFAEVNNRYFNDDYVDDISPYNRSRYNTSNNNNTYYRQKENYKADVNKEVIKAAKADLSKFKSHVTYQKPISLPYKEGDKVSHIKFGEGKVKLIKDIGKDFEVTIDFESSGERILLAGFAKLTKINQ